VVPHIHAGERIQLELACEPSNIVQAAVEARQLALPPTLTPPEGLQQWLQGGGCSLLQSAGQGLVQVCKVLLSPTVVLQVWLAVLHS
jgi:hypothetical protein